jgi:tetratricopeptide (TPR) repeat protein
VIDLGPGSIPAGAGIADGSPSLDPAGIAKALDAATRLQDAGSFPEAEVLLRQVQAAGGGDLRVLQALEALRLAQSAYRIEIAKRRAAADAHPKAQSLVGRLEQEHNRLEIDIYHLRSERHPDDLSLRLELARRLKKAGNYSGAIQRLEEARAERALAAAVLLELGECWQHLRQFGKALELYREAAQSGLAGKHQNILVAALYRIGVLAAAMDQPAEAKSALTRLLAIDPGYKDARQRLDKLP